jgi:hypothetical protein
MRTIHVTKIGPDYAKDSTRFRVQVSGSDDRTFDVLVPNTSLAVTKFPIEGKIEQKFAHGPLPEPGDTVPFQTADW